MIDLFAEIEKETAEWREAHNLPPLEYCACGKPATYLGMCNPCYQSAVMDSRREEFCAGIREFCDEERKIQEYENE